mmetsp:Transcript_12162/g.23398  ORF Transcript_12162/g.23398 Transcript_12162/m.23398 type:complete len:111 (-) Transcript_12162:222-554(-)
MSSKTPADALKECKSREEMAGLLFDALCDDGADSVNLFDFKAQLLGGQGSASEEKRIEKLFDSMDDDHNGKLSKKEFVAHYVSTHKQDVDEKFLAGAVKDLTKFQNIVSL